MPYFYTESDNVLGSRPEAQVYDPPTARLGVVVAVLVVWLVSLVLVIRLGGGM